jgi:hypothetical protein
MNTGGRSQMMPSDEPQYPFTGPQARILFFILVLFTVAVALDTCCRDWSKPNETFTTEIFVLVLFGSTISFSLAKDFSDFVKKYFLLLVLFAAPVMYIAFYPTIIIYLLSFVIATIWTLVLSIQRKGIPIWERFLMSTYVIWVVAGVLITAGRHGFLPFPEVSDVIEIKRLLHDLFENVRLLQFFDLRYLLSALFFLSMAATAIWEACHTDLPKIPRLPLLSPKRTGKRSDSVLATIIYPFLVVVEMLLDFFLLIIDAIWRLSAVICCYLFHFTSKFIIRLYNFVFSRDIWRGLIKAFASYTIVIILTYWMIFAAKDIKLYLLSNHRLSEFNLLFPNLVRILLFFVCGLLSLSSFRAIWRSRAEWRTSLDRCAMAGAVIGLAFIFSGLLVHIIKESNLIPLTGFEHFGPFLVSMVVLMGFFALYVIGKRIFESTDS